MRFSRKKKNEWAGECRNGLLQLSLAGEAGENIATKKRKYCLVTCRKKKKEAFVLGCHFALPCIVCGVSFVLFFVCLLCCDRQNLACLHAALAKGGDDWQGSKISQQCLCTHAVLSEFLPIATA
jgi:hypothetical protein